MATADAAPMHPCALVHIPAPERPIDQKSEPRRKAPSLLVRIPGEKAQIGQEYEPARMVGER